MFNNPRKQLGQNFLNDPNTQKKIINELEFDSTIDRIVEIGPGRGALTHHLIEKNIPLSVIEFDNDLANYWINQKISNLSVIHSDVLKVDFQNEFNGEKIAVIGNIPYNITTPILFKLIENKNLINQSVLMMQKEVALRLAAKPGTKDYGVLSIMHQLHTNTHLSFHVSRNVFFPKPKVDSSVINVRYFEESPFKIDNLKLFDNIVRHSFQQRRKMIRSSLKAYFSGEKSTYLQKIETLRPEELSVSDFVKLSNELNT
jgi:16S rRNA (adenine1518-N6/adenine1519-N6)-dimethyltransferase